MNEAAMESFTPTFSFTPTADHYDVTAARNAANYSITNIGTTGATIESVTPGAYDPTARQLPVTIRVNIGKSTNPVASGFSKDFSFAITYENNDLSSVFRGVNLSDFTIKTGSNREQVTLQVSDSTKADTIANAIFNS